jgi:hypothetical protein
MLLGIGVGLVLPVPRSLMAPHGDGAPATQPGTVNAAENRTRDPKSGNFDGVTASEATGIDDTCGLRSAVRARHARQPACSVSRGSPLAAQIGFVP